MHLWQAIKMACKSLWTNKLRSFLTMLGIIIGVMTVSLLTTVAQGVSNAVISSIRSQSTLAVLMNMSTDMTYGSANQVISSIQNQSSEEDDDYFKYSLVISSTSVVANNDIMNEQTDEIDENYFSFSQPYTITDEEYNALPEDKKGIADQLKIIKARKQAISTSIYAVDKNFPEVYELKIIGEFPKTDSEILIDETFVKTYLGEMPLENAIGKDVTLGTTVTTDVTIMFNEQQTQATVLIIKGIIDKASLSLNSEVTLSDDGKTITFNSDYFRMMNEQTLKDTLNAIFAQTGSSSVATSVSFKDKYELDNAKVYKISGVLSDKDNTSMFGGGASSMMGDENDKTLSAMSIMRAGFETQKGTIYMFADNTNAMVLGEEDIENSVIAYAYMRYKTEDVMEASINKISTAFLPKLMVMRDYMLVSMSSVANIISNVMNILTIMLTVISVISLIVGGIGIMNIMLVAVTERTREIGIRKAIGAKRSSILVQFLIEALLLSMLGGAIGLIISAIGTAIIGSLMGVAMSMPFWIVAMSIGFCTAIGLIFGMFPAVKASHMQPIDALRRE